MAITRIYAVNPQGRLKVLKFENEPLPNSQGILKFYIDEPLLIVGLYSDLYIHLSKGSNPEERFMLDLSIEDRIKFAALLPLEFYRPEGSDISFVWTYD